MNANEKQPDQWTHMQLTDDDASEPVHNKTEITTSKKTLQAQDTDTHIRIHSEKQKPCNSTRMQMNQTYGLTCNSRTTTLSSPFTHH